jgi:hypothetical protein
MKKALFYILLLLNFIYPLKIVSNALDGDFGWHLRFGQDIHTQATFPYLDTYTYTKFGQPWINHEWGGDWLFYQIYTNLGYFWINIITALVSTLAFLIIGKAFCKKITPSFLFFSLTCQMAVFHIFSPRLAMFGQFFAALIILAFEKYDTHPRALYIIPVIIYLWSILHGSWILGFIIVNLYLGAAILPNLIPEKYHQYFTDKKRSKAFIYQLIIVQIIAAGLVIINPYGIKIWTEVLQYFGQNYYKSHISEWTPSYAYPVFPKILILQTISLVLIIYGAYKKRVRLTHVLFFIAFFLAAFFYKRQGIFTALLSAPILEHTAILVRTELSRFSLYKFIQRQQDKFYWMLAMLFIFLLVVYSLLIHYTTDPWNDQKLSNNNAPPYEATTFLQQYIANKKVKIFNEFSWGGYLNWMLPNALVYLDGRGTATWMYDKDTSMLEYYINLKERDDAVKIIEQEGADYIMLRQPTFIISGRPGWTDKYLFGKNFKKYFVDHEKKLEEQINNSPSWQKIYNDKRAIIWKHIDTLPARER